MRKEQCQAKGLSMKRSKVVFEEKLMEGTKYLSFELLELLLDTLKLNNRCRDNILLGKSILYICEGRTLSFSSNKLKVIRK